MMEYQAMFLNTQELIFISHIKDTNTEVVCLLNTKWLKKLKSLRNKDFYFLPCIFWTIFNNNKLYI